MSPHATEFATSPGLTSSARGAVVAFEIARAFCEKFGGDSLGEMHRNHRAYLEYLASR